MRGLRKTYSYALQGLGGSLAHIYLGCALQLYVLSYVVFRAREGANLRRPACKATVQNRFLKGVGAESSIMATRGEGVGVTCSFRPWVVGRTA